MLQVVRGWEVRVIRVTKNKNTQEGYQLHVKVSR